MPERSFLGSGMKFPPQVNKATGRFEVSVGEQSVKESIYLILMTQRAERFLREDFGSDLMTYTFMDVNATTVNMMSRAISEQILHQEPRVQNVTVTADPDVKEGCLIVNIEYTIRESNVRDNLVFPFYLNTSAFEEEEAYEPEEEEV